MNQSHYPDQTVVEAENRHTLAVIVDNEPGVLARIAGLFSGRGYNIESLTVSETQHERHVSRITIVTTGTAAVIDQIKAQLERLVPVHRVDDLTVRGEALERELCLAKVVGDGEHRVEALRRAGWPRGSSSAPACQVPLPCAGLNAGSCVRRRPRPCSRTGPSPGPLPWSIADPGSGPSAQAEQKYPHRAPIIRVSGQSEGLSTSI